MEYLTMTANNNLIRYILFISSVNRWVYTPNKHTPFNSVYGVLYEGGEATRKTTINSVQ